MNRAVAMSVPGSPAALDTDASAIERFLEDAAHYPGGHAAAVARPGSLEEVVQVVRDAKSVLPVGAQSSLTGGATPAGDVVLSTERLKRLDIDEDIVVAGAGVTLVELQHALGERNLWFPPVPTFLGATVGGVVSTNAAGAATFKYGPVRPWVQALTIVLASGDVLRVARGEVTAVSGRFVVETHGGSREIAIPQIEIPDVPKCSAGYFSRPGMDLVDLFIGSEGTLGVILEAAVRTARRPRGVLWIFAAMPSEDDAIAMTASLRHEPGLDVAAIEHIDGRSIAILREDGVDRRLGIRIPPDAGTLLLAQVELSATGAEDGLDDATVDALGRVLRAHGADDSAEIVLPADHRRSAALVELREAVPAGVNRRVALAHAADPRVHKTAADMIVPFARFGDMMRTCRQLAAREGLDLAVWGHISDGNVHPNVIPRHYGDVERGHIMLLELAREVIGMGGSPLAEHGVGRNPIKQQLLEMLYGPDGVEAMRGVKRSLDPDWRLAPGVLFGRMIEAHAR